MKKFLILIILMLSFSAYANPISATGMLLLCTKNNDLARAGCDAFFEGYLEGLVTGTSLVDWNLPKNQLLSAETIKNSFIEFTQRNSSVGSHPVGTVVTLALVQQGIVKLKKPLPVTAN